MYFRTHFRIDGRKSLICVGHRSTNDSRAWPHATARGQEEGKQRGEAVPCQHGAQQTSTPRPLPPSAALGWFTHLEANLAHVVGGLLVSLGCLVGNGLEHLGHNVCQKPAQAEAHLQPPSKQQGVG
jgi:hypothetical protein